MVIQPAGHIEYICAAKWKSIVMKIMQYSLTFSCSCLYLM